MPVGAQLPPPLASELDPDGHDSHAAMTLPSGHVWFGSMPVSGVDGGTDEGGVVRPVSPPEDDGGEFEEDGDERQRPSTKRVSTQEDPFDLEDGGADCVGLTTVTVVVALTVEHPGVGEVSQMLRL